MLRRIARAIRGAVPLIHRLAQRLEGDALNLPYMQMNAYDQEVITRTIVESTGAPPRVVSRNEGQIEGALFLARKPR